MRMVLSAVFKTAAKTEHKSKHPTFEMKIFISFNIQNFLTHTHLVFQKKTSVLPCMRGNHNVPAHKEVVHNTTSKLC